jgi:hypothetical protein
MGEMMRKLLISNRQRFTACIFYVFCIFLIMLISGCGGGGDDSFSSGPSETGSASFTIAWHDTPVIQAADEEAPPVPVDCSLIKNIICEVYDELDNFLTSEVFDCYRGHGTINNIPEGENRKFVLLGKDAGENFLYHGEASGKTIKKDQTTDVGPIDCSGFVPKGFYIDDIESPNEIILYWNSTDDDEVKGYNVYMNGEFLKSVATPSTIVDRSPINQQSCFTVSAYDAWDNESGHCSPDCTTTEGGTCSYSISPTSLKFSSSGGTGTINVTASASECEWTPTEGVDWISITSGSSGSGNGTVTYSVSPNTTSDYLMARIVFTPFFFPSHLVTQGAGPCDSATIINDGSNFYDAGGEGYIYVNASEDCQWQATSSNESWLRVFDWSSSGTGNGGVTYRVSSTVWTDDYTFREAEIVVSGGNGAFSWQIIVRQEGEFPYPQGD